MDCVATVASAAAADDDDDETNETEIPSLHNKLLISYLNQSVEAVEYLCPTCLERGKQKTGLYESDSPDEYEGDIYLD